MLHHLAPTHRVNQYYEVHRKWVVHVVCVSQPLHDNNGWMCGANVFNQEIKKMLSSFLTHQGIMKSGLPFHVHQRIKSVLMFYATIL